MAQAPLDPLYGEFLADTDWTPANKINAVSVLNAWHRWLVAHDLEPLTVARPDIRAWLEDLATTGLAPATRQVRWRMLRAFYRWAATPVRDGGGGELRDSPMDGVKAPSVPTRPATRAAKADDVRRLEEGFDNSELGRRGAAMVSLMFRSGCRVGELPWLDLAHYSVRPDGHAILDVPRTKTDEPRTVPIHPETQRYLERYLRRRGRMPGPLFRGDTSRTRDPNGRLTSSSIRQVIDRAADRVGLDVSSHQLRRGWTAQWLRQSRGDVLSLEIIGGWADHRMPRRYLADEEAAAAIDRYFDVVDPEQAPERLRSV